MLIFFFFLFPFFTIIFYTLNLWRGWNHKVNRIWYLAIMLAVYLGLLNSTKELSGDFLDYSEYFYNVPKQDSS